MSPVVSCLTVSLSLRSVHPRVSAVCLFIQPFIMGLPTLTHSVVDCHDCRPRGLKHTYSVIHTVSRQCASLGRSRARAALLLLLRPRPIYAHVLSVQLTLLFFSLDRFTVYAHLLGREHCYNNNVIVIIYDISFDTAVVGGYNTIIHL